MSSLKRVLSSRANGARSRGPITPAGKQASSLNAVRHGLLANCVVLSNECRENFDILLDQHIQRYSPIDDVELGVIEEMVAAFWRLRRAWAIETRLHEDAMATREPGDELGRLTGAFTDLASSPQLGLLHRYEARLHHIRQRAFENIQILRNTQPPNGPSLAPAPAEPAPAPPPAPIPPTPPTSTVGRTSVCPSTIVSTPPLAPTTPAKFAPPKLPNEPTLAPATPVTPAKLAPPKLPNEPTLAPAKPAEPAPPPLPAARAFLVISRGETAGPKEQP